MRGESDCRPGQRRNPTSRVLLEISCTSAAAEPVLERLWQNSASLAVKKWWTQSGLRTK